MPRLSRLAASLALVAALVAVWFLFSSDGPVTEPVDDLVGDVPDRRAADPDLSERPKQGGVYAGNVVDLRGRPIHGAHVLLVSYSTGAPQMDLGAPEADSEDITDIPVIGRMGEAGEGISDEEGAFRIAADSQAVITRVLAYHEGYFLSVVSVNRPRNDIVLRLQEAGKVIGTVVDDVTGAPVQGARVDIYLQQKVDKVPDAPAGSGPYPVINRQQYAKSWLATLGRFTSKVLGPRIWSVHDSGSETLRLWTDANGHFEIGPLGNTVQVEFVVTHPDYKWHDFDTDEGKHTPKRLVVEPGQKIEREFRLRRGFHISGQVSDDEGNGLSEVYIKVQSISAYYRHWWYRDKWRIARTDKQGNFRVDGLAEGAQTIILMHPSFKQKVVHVPRVPSDNLMVLAERFGALQARVAGVGSSSIRRRVLVLFESVEENPEGPRQFRRNERLTTDGELIVQRIPPGHYRTWIKLGKVSSQPTEVKIEPLKITKTDFELGAGGSIVARVMDPDGGIIDPASVRLVSLRNGKEHALGTFVSREGDIDIEGVAPGPYKLRVRAPGRIEVTTKSFEVSEARTANLGVVELNQWGFLRFGHPLDAAGRAANITETLIVEWRRAPGTWQRVHNAGIDVSVHPGDVEIRAHSGEMKWTGKAKVEGGKTTAIEIVFQDAR